MSVYGAFARYYDKLTQNVDYPARAMYFDELVRRHGSRGDSLLLDLACGTGSLSLALAAAGYEVIGVDASADMLTVAMNKAADADRQVLWLRQPMDALDLYGTVDVTVCALDSLNHLPGRDVLAAVFQRVSLFTAQGGLFLFDVNTAYKHREILGDNAFVYETEGVFCVWQNHYYPEDGRVEMELDFFEEVPGQAYLRSSECFKEYVFDHALLEQELKNAGFNLLAVYGDDGFDPPHAETQRAVYVAGKEIG